MIDQPPKRGDDEAFNKIVDAEKLQLLSTLPDLSVTPEVASILKRLRWYGVVEVKLPEELQGKDCEFLEDILETRLQGREPLPTVEGATVLASFAVHDESDATLGHVYGFAVGLANSLGVPPEQSIVQSRVIYVDTSEFDHIAPNDRFPFPEL